MNTDILRYKTMLSWIKLYTRGGSISQQLEKMGIKKIIVYGATEIGEVFIEQAKLEKIDIVGICDGRIIKRGAYFEGIPLLSRNDIDGIDATIIITAMGFLDEIMSEWKGRIRAIPIRELLEG